MILNTYQWEDDTFYICLDLATKEYYVYTDWDEVSPRRKNLWEIRDYAIKSFQVDYDDFYYAMIEAIEETMSSPVMALVRALLTGE